MAAARAGADWAWAEIHHDLAPSMLRYLCARGASEPEELLGTAFLDIVRALPRFEGGYDDFRTWAFTIAHHRLVDDLRRQRRRPQPAPEAAGEATQAAGDAVDDALQPLAERDLLRELERLTPDQRDVIVLRILIGFSIADTARVLGRRPGAVKALQVRALEALRRSLSDPPVSFSTRPAITDPE